MTATLPPQAFDDLQQTIQGHVVLPDTEGYDRARSVWNAMIDRRPAAIVQCAEPADVPHVLRFAREFGLPLSVRGGGHNIAGSAMVDAGVVLDMSRMTRVVVDPAARLAFVEAGATLAALDAATQAHGLATPVGINSTTGVAGLTLGGGFGWLTRQYGMTVDSLRAADIVLADGTALTVDERQHPELFWAIRGGGGNFGVVTRFVFALHPVGPDVLTGLVVFAHKDAPQVLRAYREYVESAPEELNVWAILRQAPPLPFLPPEVHGSDVLVLAGFYNGDAETGMPHFEALKRMGNPVGSHVGVQPYASWQQAFDPLLTPGARNYWKSHNFTRLADGALDCMVEFAGQLPSPQCEIFVGFVGGRANRVPADATAYSSRDARYVMNVHGRWETAGQDAQGIEWARRFFAAAAPFASAGAYVNFMTEEESGRVAAAYGLNYARLVEAKRRYDPTNVFRFNQNIRP